MTAEVSGSDPDAARKAEREQKRPLRLKRRLFVYPLLALAAGCALWMAWPQPENGRRTEIKLGSWAPRNWKFRKVTFSANERFGGELRTMDLVIYEAGPFRIFRFGSYKPKLEPIGSHRLAAGDRIYDSQTGNPVFTVLKVDDGHDLGGGVRGRAVLVKRTTGGQEWLSQEDVSRALREKK